MASNATNIVEFAQELKRDIAIEDLISDYVPTLKRTGRTWKGHCPFHDEKTPSFNVNPEFGFYHCFGCGVGGDAIKFVQEYEKVDFPMAIELIARRFGVRVPEFRSSKSREEAERDRDKRKLLLGVCALAAEYFARQLDEHPDARPARAYIEQRGITPDQIKTYGLGFAPPGYDGFMKIAERRGYTPEQIAEAGLAGRSDRGKFYDRFRARITFPIADHPNNDIVGFGGRLVQGDEGPKYLNSPETPLFHKGKLLFGLGAARDAIRTEGRVIILEGYMDWIALHSNGICNVVAGLGTALGEEQGRLLRRMTEEVVLHYDGDDAGAKAMFRASEILLGRDLSVRIVRLPTGHDPDSFIREGGSGETRRLIEDAPQAIDHYLHEATEQHSSGSPQANVAIFERVAPLIRAVSDPILRESYVNHLGEILRLKPQTILRKLESRTRSRTAAPRDEDRPAPPRNEIKLDPLECRLLNLLIRNVGDWRFFSDLDREAFQEESVKQVLSIVYEIAWDIREGGEIPSDWTAIFTQSANSATFHTILCYGEAEGSGSADTTELDNPENALRQSQSLARRLRARRIKSMRSEMGRRLRSTPGGFSEHDEGLKAIQQHSESILRKSN